MDSDTFITQEKARELETLLVQARDLLYSASPGPDVTDTDDYLDAVANWQRDVKATLDN